jgi:cell division protein DivIC
MEKIFMKFSLDKIPPILKNKFVITGFVFFTWLMFFDKNNLLDRISNLRLLSDLKEVEEYYIVQNRQDSIRIQELMTNSENLEKFAREQYFMKKNNEDIFVIVEE